MDRFVAALRHLQRLPWRQRIALLFLWYLAVLALLVGVLSATPFPAGWHPPILELLGAGILAFGLLLLLAPLGQPLGTRGAALPVVVMGLLLIFHRTLLRTASDYELFAALGLLAFALTALFGRETAPAGSQPPAPPRNRGRPR